MMMRIPTTDRSVQLSRPGTAKAVYIWVRACAAMVSLLIVLGGCQGAPGTQQPTPRSPVTPSGPDAPQSPTAPSGPNTPQSPTTPSGPNTPQRPSTPQSPDQYLENPVVRTAIEQSDFPVRRGTSPPRLSGVYAVSGRIVDTSAAFQEWRNAPVRSTDLRLFNQTAAGAISLRENFLGTSVEATGGYVTGDGAVFTIWQTSRQDVRALMRQISDARDIPSIEWPYEEECIIVVALLMSGRRASDGDLQGVEGLTSYVDLVDCPIPAIRARLANGWYKWQADFDLRTPMSRKQLDVEAEGEKIGE